MRFECLLGAGLWAECWRSQGEQAALPPRELRLQAWRAEGNAILWKDVHSRQRQRGGGGRIQAQLDPARLSPQEDADTLHRWDWFKNPENLVFVNNPSYQRGNLRPTGQIHAAACFCKAWKLRIVFPFFFFLNFFFFFFFRNSRSFIYLFIYLWLCWVFVSLQGLSLVVASGDHSSSRCAGLSPSRPLLLRSTHSRRAGSVIVAHGPSCSMACGILPDQGSNPCPLHWQADSQPLRHQGSPSPF